MLEINSGMIRNITPLLLALFVSYAGLAQLPNPDRVPELKEKLATTSNDSSRIRYLLSISFHLSYRDFKEAQKHCDQAEALAVIHLFAKRQKEISNGHVFQLRYASSSIGTA